ncbi:hypothetical protein AnigIFM63604_002076 [Aspergillus niger]|uniref:phospholipase A2 n=2 Tax=Aspergillus TaxID=5052 RepID=A0A9W6AC54_ASPNG|nr:hypothetical protein AnigIFM63604_002076 [Aspergillus niger]
MPGRGIALLSLDGGGVRGLSSLHILKHLMERIKDEKGLAEEPKPCEYFDMIGGTSTGGLIAIMLGHLQMTVNECIRAYLALTQRVFTPIRSRSVSLGFSKHLGDVVSRFDSAALEEVVKRVIRDALLDPDALFYDEDRASKCKVFVCALQAEIATPVLLTNYKSKRSDSDRRESVKIWQAARATSAASGFFDAQEIEMSAGYVETYTDGATGYNNPVRQLWTEAREVLLPQGERLEDHLDAIVSIGTGTPELKAFGTNLKDIATTLVRIATDTDNTANHFQREYKELDRDGLYCRLSVANGLQHIGLEDYKQANNIMAATKAYLDHPDTLSKLTKCLERMSQHECLYEKNPTDRAQNQETHLPFPTSTARALKILDSISAYNHDRVQLSLAQERLPGTAGWIFENDQYKEWRNAHHTSFLLCTGPIGCGKTILATSVTETLLKQSSPVFYYFCHKSWEASPDAQSILRSILKQVVLFCAQTRQPLSDKTVAHLEKAAQGSTKLDARELIINNLPLLADAFLIIDGLDVLDESHISQLRETLSTISQSPQVHRLRTALFYRRTLVRGVDLSAQWISTIQLPLSIDHLESDIRTLVNYEVDRRQQYRKITDSALTLEWIKTELVSRGEQMFLWILLQLDSLWTDVYSEADIRDRMNQLPRGLESTYNRCLEQIVRVRDNKHGQLAHKIMLWTVCATRQLTTIEIQQLVALEDKDEEIHSEKFLNHDPTVYCANLLVLGPGGPRFTHPSVKQFLTDPSKLDPELKWEALPLEVANCRVGRLCGMFMKRHLQLVPRERKTKTPVDVAVHMMREVRTNPVVQKIIDSPFGLRVIDASIRQKARISIDQIAHNARHVYSQAVSPQPAHVTNPDDFAPIMHYIYQSWLSHTLDMTRDEFREQFFQICLYSDAWLPWKSEGKYEVEHLRNLIQCAISAAHIPLLYLACDQVEKMDKYNAVFGKPLANDLLPINYAITTGNLGMVDIFLNYYFLHGSLGSSLKNAVLHAARCNNSDILKYFEKKLPNIMGERSTIDSLFDAIIANDNPHLLQWWIYTFQRVRHTQSVSNQFLKAVLEICKIHIQRTACLIPLLEQWVRMEATADSQTALISRVNALRLPKDCLPVIVQIGKTSPVEFTLSQLELLTPGDTDSLLDAALTLPPGNALPILKLVILHNRRKEEHWVKEAVLGPKDQFSRRLLPWLTQLFCAIVPENGAIVTDELQASTLLKLLEVLPDETLVDLLASHCPDCQLRDRWNHNILYALAHRPTAKALQVLKARNLLSHLDLNATDDYGWGPMHVAATRGYNEVVIFLLVHGADPKRRNDRSETPAKLAENSGSTPTIAILDRWENSPIETLYRAFMEQHAAALQTHPGMDWEWGLQLSVWRALDHLYAKAEDTGEPISSVTLDSVATGIRITSPSSFPDDYSYYMRSQQMWIRQ